MSEPPAHLPEAVDIGGDLVAAILSGVPGVGGIAAGSILAVGNFKVRKRLAYLESVVERLEGDVERLTNALKNPPFAELVIAGLNVAETTDEGSETWEMVGAIVAYGILDAGPSSTERARFLLGVVNQLSPLQIALLKELGMVRFMDGHSYFNPDGGRELDDRGIAVRFPDIADLVDPIVADLESKGLIRDFAPSALVPDPKLGGIPQRLWRLTPFGTELLKFLNPGPYQSGRDEP